jgi:hypothetical protein
MFLLKLMTMVLPILGGRAQGAAFSALGAGAYRRKPHRTASRANWSDNRDEELTCPL